VHLLIISKVSFPATNRYLPDWEQMRALGHTISFNTATSKPDAILCMSVSVMEETWVALAKWPRVSLFCYNWDCYSWVWIRPRATEYDYRRYGELLRHAVEIWVPSYCTGQQTSLWWSLFNWKVIPSACPTWDYANVRDDGFALCPLRKLPDHWCDKFAEACNELSIPYKTPDHNLSYREYQDIVASCRFLVSHYQEASTGGLTLLEGYYLGKSVLLTDSEWNGAHNYFGDRATYFRHGDFDNFKYWLQRMYDNPRPVLADHRKWVEDNYNDQRMISDMLERINAHLS
jgi:hypothetical protein